MMLVYDEKKERTIKRHQYVRFSSFSAFHLIIITARVKSGTQIAPGATDDEDLVITIDDKLFPQRFDVHNIINSPATFSGGTLHNLSKTVYFLTFLKGKEHTVTLRTDTPHSMATLEALTIYTMRPRQELSLAVENQAEDGDRRPWITVALESFSLKTFSATVVYSRRKRDSDDVKIVVDNRVQSNLLKSIKRYLWRYVGSLLPSFATKTETESFVVDLPRGLHYLEFWADRMPTLRSLTLDFGAPPRFPEGIPTVDDPTWTKDFYDDTEEMILARMIFGEAENQPREAKIGVGFSVLNRIHKQKNQWGLSAHEVILKENQYDAMWNSNTREKIRDPLEDTSTHFHSLTDPKDFPSWAMQENYKTKIGAFFFYELER